MKKIICLTLVCLMIIGTAPAASAASGEAERAAQALYELGLFKGSGVDAEGNPSFELDRVPTRYEAVTMLVRLLGKENAANNGIWTTPFTDVAAWAIPYVGYAYSNGLANGDSKTTFGGSGPATATMYLTFVLRALGYDSSADFKWDAAWELTDRLGITNGEYDQNTNSGFTRGDAVIVSFAALEMELKGSGGVTLAEKLIGEGVFTREEYEGARATADPSGITGIKLNKDFAYLSEGEMVDLDVVTPGIRQEDVVWTITDGESFSVDKNGVVSFTEPEKGNAPSTITAVYDGKTASCVVMYKKTDDITRLHGTTYEYVRFPGLLSFDNVSLDTPVSSFYDSFDPLIGSYDYVYFYTVDNLAKAERLAEEYARWLEQHGYTLIREEDDPVERDQIGNDMLYELKDPTGRYDILIKGKYYGKSYGEVYVRVDYENARPVSPVKVENLVGTLYENGDKIFTCDVINNSDKVIDYVKLDWCFFDTYWDLYEAYYQTGGFEDILNHGLAYSIERFGPGEKISINSEYYGKKWAQHIFLYKVLVIYKDGTDELIEVGRYTNYWDGWEK